MVTERNVVTCFLVSRGRVLLLHRSSQVGNYQGRWASVTGPVKDDPMAQALREVHEETGYLPGDLHLVSRGRPIELMDESRQMRFRVHPFLFRVEEPEAVQLGWEHSNFRWVDPRQLDQYPIVPMLNETLARVWDVAELGPITGVMRSQDFLTGSLAAAESGTPLTERNDHALSEPGRLEHPMPRNHEIRSGGFSGIADTIDDDALDGSFVPDDTPAIAADEAPDDLPLATGVRVRVIRTGEFPLPGLSPAHLDTDAPPPGRTGPELLEDPLLAPALAAIRDDRVMQSGALVHRALEALRLAGDRSNAPFNADWFDDLRMVGRTLTSVRPSLASIAFAMAQSLYDVGFELDRIEERHELRKVLRQSISSQEEQEKQAGSKLADEVSRLIPPAGLVMTLGYCPALMDGLQRCTHFGIRVIVPEGRPLQDGRLAARAILATGKSATVIADAAIGLHVGEADLAIIGAEGLLADGSVVTRTGAYLLALAARAARVPLYVVSPLSRLDLRPDAVDQLVLEEKEPGEVWDEAVPGLDVRNVHYERVPPELITGIVTEDGLMAPSAIDWEVRARDYLLEALTGKVP